MRLAVEAIALLVGGAALGLAGNAFAPKRAQLSVPMAASAEQPGASCELPGGRMPEVRRISVTEATPLCAACSAIFIDARTAAEFAQGHVSGALHLAPGEPIERVLSRVRDAPAIVYDRDPSCSQADAVARALQAGGARDVRVLTGAWPAWMAAGAPGAAGPCAACESEKRP